MSIFFAQLLVALVAFMLIGIQVPARLPVYYGIWSLNWPYYIFGIPPAGLVYNTIIDVH
jgi:hypothetical protein